MLRLRRKHEVGFASSVLARAHEHVFLERYERLCDWAGRFTGSREDAIDVAHDAYVMFTLKKPDLSSIEKASKPEGSQANAVNFR